MWFGEVTGLSPELARLSASAALLAVLMPGYAALQSWYTGVLVHAHRTRPITEAVALYLGVTSALLFVAVRWQRYPGIHSALVAFTCAGVLQTLWLQYRTRAERAVLEPPGRLVSARPLS